MATTTNFGWETPDDTDLVKDGAAAMRTLGNSIDTSFVDLKGGTTGQFLSKASNTDLDYSWTTAGSGGLTLIATASPSATSAVNFDNVFSATYQNYQVFYNVAGTTGAEINIRLRVGGVTATSTYITQNLQVNGTSITAARDTSSNLWTSGAVRGTGRSFGVLNISNPFVAAISSYTSFGIDPENNARIELRSGSMTNATSYDGFNFYVDSGTITGSIRVYGVQNS